MAAFSPFLQLVPLFVLISACGPATYLSTVSRDAADAVEEIQAAGAEQKAPYEYWSARTYLRMARYKAGQADFEIAIDYGRRTLSMCDAAARIIRRGGIQRPGVDDAPPGLQTTIDDPLGTPAQSLAHTVVARPTATAATPPQPGQP